MTKRQTVTDRQTDTTDRHGQTDRQRHTETATDCQRQPGTDLRAHVVEGADEAGASVRAGEEGRVAAQDVAVHARGKAEINELVNVPSGLAVAPAAGVARALHDVGGLDVAVDEALGVEELQGGQHVASHGHAIKEVNAGAWGVFVQDLLEGSAVEPLHSDEEAV